MKRIYHLFFLVIFYACSIVGAYANIPAPLLDVSSAIPPSALLSTLRIPQEGFLGDTVVQIPTGYKQIEKLSIGDDVIDDNGKTKKIVAITKHYQWLIVEKTRLVKNSAIVEEYFARNGIPIANVRAETRDMLAKQRKTINAQAVIAANSKLSNTVVSGGSGKDPEEDDEPEKDVYDKQGPFETAKEAEEAAEKLGFKKTNYRSQGQPVFKKSNRYITPDQTSHNGGVWKMADSVENLGSKITRMGTYDASLNWIGK